MSKLIKIDDNKKIRSSEIPKNAMFYKDMLAFYDAYENLMNAGKDSLPNFIYWNGSICLEGVCLFMRDYSSALGFESLNLSLSYLKVLYYTLASMSDNDEMPEREVVEEEIKKYNDLIFEKVNGLAQDKERVDIEFNFAKRDYSKKSRSNLKNQTLSHTYNVLAILFLLVGIFCVIAPFTFYFLDTIQFLYALLISFACIAVGITLFIIFKKLSKVYDSRENGTAYESQRSKRIKEEKTENFDEFNSNYNKLLCEKYECKNNLNKILFDEGRSSFDEILSMSNEYSILSYNIRRDCIILFKNQDEDINNILNLLSRPTKIEDGPKEMSEIYKKIKAKDWLYYSNVVRLSYLSKYIELAEKSFVWELDDRSTKTPFGIDIKKIAKQQIAFLKNRDGLFISSTIDQFSKTNYLKKQDVFKLKKSVSEEELRNLKTAYSTKFYDYFAIKDYNNIFYDRKIADGGRVPDSIIENNAQIPTLVFIKLRLIENQTGLDYADSSVVQDVEEEVFFEDIELTKPIDEGISVVEAKPTEIKASFECNEVEELPNGTVRYKFGSDTVTGISI